VVKHSKCWQEKPLHKWPSREVGFNDPKKLAVMGNLWPWKVASKKERSNNRWIINGGIPRKTLKLASFCRVVPCLKSDVCVWNIKLFIRRPIFANQIWKNRLENCLFINV